MLSLLFPTTTSPFIISEKSLIFIGFSSSDISKIASFNISLSSIVANSLDINAPFILSILTNAFIIFLTIFRPGD